MISIEDRLRDAYRAAAATVSPDDVRQLDGPTVPAVPGARAAWARRRRFSRQIVAPLAAASAVALIVILAVVVVPQIFGAGPGPQRSGPLRVPRFVIAFRTVGTISSPTALTVRNPATGALVARIPSPKRKLFFSGVTTGDGRHYVASLGQEGVCRTWFYQFQLSRTGRPSALTPYRLPMIRELPLVIALSRDNALFAYAGERCIGTPAARIYPNFLSVLNLTTMRTTTWGLPNLADPDSLSITASDRDVVFTLQKTSRFKSAAYLLPTAAAPGPVLARSRTIITMPDHGENGPGISSGVVTPDGMTLYLACSGRQNYATGAFQWQLVRVDVATGRSRVIASAMADDPFTLAADPRVDAVLVAAHPPVLRVQTLRLVAFARRASSSPTPSPSLSPPMPSPSPSPSPTPGSSAHLVLINLRTGAVRYLSPAAANTIYFW